MGAKNEAGNKPLWYEIEEAILGLTDAELDAGRREATVAKIAAALDDKGRTVSKTGPELLRLRWALEARAARGRPLLGDLNQALAAFQLEDLGNTHGATFELVRKLGADWPVLKAEGGIGDIRVLVEATKLDLMIAKAKSLEGDQGIRYLRAEEIAGETILARMDIDQERLDEIDAAFAAEKAEIRRVEGLLAAVAGKPDPDRIRHLVTNDVSQASIIEIGGFTEGAIDEVNRSMEAELREKRRLAEQEAARKKAEAEGPGLDEIPADELLDYIESLREILDFSDVEKEIRVMSEQSSIPKALVDVAVTDPDKLDELEEQAEG